MSFMLYVFKRQWLAVILFFACLFGFVAPAFPSDSIAVDDFEWVADTDAEVDFYTVGDLDGDGAVDLAAADPGDDTAGEDAGAVYVFLSATLLADDDGVIDLVDADHVILGGEAGVGLGMGVSDAGDEDGDGLDDILVAMAGADETELVLAADMGFGGETVDGDSKPRAVVVTGTIGVAESVDCALNPGATAVPEHGWVFILGMGVGFFLLFRLLFKKAD